MKTDNDFVKYAEELRECFFRSESLAIELQRVLVAEGAPPASVAFAFLVIDRGIESQIEGWETLKSICKSAFDKMDEEGVLPIFQRGTGNVVMGKKKK